MIVYLAKDWTGTYVFKEEPHLIKCGGMPDIWTGHKLKCFELAEDIISEIPNNKFIKRNIWWSVVNII